MNSNPVNLAVGDREFPGRLNVPDAGFETGVLVIPGANHGPFGDVFDRFAGAGAGEGHAVARFETWRDADERSEKTAADFEAEVAAGVEFLRSRGCSTTAVVAKSFGGRIALEHAPEKFDRMVLWAPAVMFGDHERRPSIDAAALDAIDTPIRVLQGDEDEVVTVENSAAIVEHLPEGELVELPGEDHSFRTDEDRVIEETLAFLDA